MPAGLQTEVVASCSDRGSVWFYSSRGPSSGFINTICLALPLERRLAPPLQVTHIHTCKMIQVDLGWCLEELEECEGVV